MELSQNSVALVKYKDSVKQALEEGLTHIGGFGALESPVLIKPNICTISDGTGYSVTRIETVKALVELLLKTDEKLTIKIIESDSQSKFAEESFQKFGYSQLCEDMQQTGFDVSTVDLSRTPLMELSFIGDFQSMPMKTAIAPRKYNTFLQPPRRGDSMVELINGPSINPRPKPMADIPIAKPRFLPLNQIPTV